ncbi:MAG: helix-turn-helix transcriptional regulator [Nitrospirae bacterium]|nr:helix-turn-helix transcriptional regulator [Nitrospirota bacterium]
MNGNEFLKSKRIEKGLSLREFSIKCGVSHSYIHNLEKGTKEVTLKTLLKILDALDVSIFKFFREIGYETPAKKRRVKKSADEAGFDRPIVCLTATRYERPMMASGVENKRKPGKGFEPSTC